MRFLPFIAITCLCHCASRAEVVLTQNERSFEMTNEKLAATFEKTSGRITSVKLGGQNVLGKGTGYWSMSASSGQSRVGGFGNALEQRISIDPAANGGERAEVVFGFHGTGEDGAYPGRSEIRYSLGRDSTTIHATAVLTHGEGDAPFRIGEGRFVIKLDDAIFDQMTVDKDRNWIMPTGRDWEAGSPLNMSEVRRMTTGIHKGWAEHKYSYSAILEEVPAYGWLGTKRRFGVWMINPSVEYIAGGPTKMELTGHLDVGGYALPTLLNMWHGSHYGGTVLVLARDEEWSKVIGPFAIHFNEGGSPDELWKAALAEAAAERAAWPYPWVRHEAYPPAARRGAVSGKILPDETPDLSENNEMWVGLAVPAYSVAGRRSSETVGWQRDGKFYQYWVRAEPDGAFSIPGVRPGEYVLHAFRDGILGEFELPGIRVSAGDVTLAGDLQWTPERAGPTLWEIGIPDRSAAEFRNGDQFWHWGNYLKFKQDFPVGVNYQVGQSDWRKDWHICQPLDLSEDGKVLGSSTWNVKFPLETVPRDGARLRLSFCGSRSGASLAVLLNGAKIGDTGPLPENGAMHRDSHRGLWFERSFDIPAARLRSGQNILQLRLNGNAWHQGVLYDYIRLEEVAQASASS